VIVIDASALAETLLGRRAALVAVEDALAGDGDQPLNAPELIEPETLQALRRLALAGAVGEARAAEAVGDLASVRLRRYPHAPLRERVWALRHDLTAYDASYLALAEALPDPLLVTADAGLAARARRSLGAAGVAMIPESASGR
jgi:predicted nucleic acid-binding protein